MSVERSQLKNGLTVVSHAMPEVETVSLGIWIGAGSRSEAVAEHGVAHFLEHMAFKGTARRSARDIAEEIEAVGGELNAATGVDSTAYYARVMRKDLALALDILSDILLSPRFDRTELGRERDVILQEIAAAMDSPDDIAFDLVQEAAFPDQPLGRPILGTAESVRRFKRDHLGAYLTMHYHAPNMALSAAGAVDHASLVAEAERRLGDFDPKTAPAPEAARYTGGVRRSEKGIHHHLSGPHLQAYVTELAWREDFRRASNGSQFSMLADASAQAPKGIDGISFAPTLRGQPEKQQKHAHLFWEFHGYGGQQAVRLGDWKGVRRNIHRGDTKVELYHLKDDVGEKNDLADRHPEIVKQIEKILSSDRVPSQLFPMKVLDEK